MKEGICCYCCSVLLLILVRTELPFLRQVTLLTFMHFQYSYHLSFESDVQHHTLYIGFKAEKASIPHLLSYLSECKYFTGEGLVRDR